MNKIKSILAFVALMLCGGAWATEQVLTWESPYTDGGITHVLGGGTSYGVAPTTVFRGVEWATFAAYPEVDAMLGGYSDDYLGNSHFKVLPTHIVYPETQSEGEILVQFQIKESDSMLKWATVKFTGATENGVPVIKAVQLPNTSDHYYTGVNQSTSIAAGSWLDKKPGDNNYAGQNNLDRYPVTRLVYKGLDAYVENLLKTSTNLKMHLDASNAENFEYNENGEVTTWKNLANANNNAVAYTTNKGTRTYVNGVPAYQMGNINSGIDLSWTRLGMIRTCFWVMDIKQGMGAFFLGDNSVSDFHRGDNGEYAGYSWCANGYKNGEMKCDGASVDMATKVPTGLHIYSHVSTDNLHSDRLTQDRSQARNGGRAISELIVFNTELTSYQVAAVEKYLSRKWGVPLTEDVQTDSISVNLCVRNAAYHNILESDAYVGAYPVLGKYWNNAPVKSLDNAQYVAYLSTKDGKGATTSVKVSAFAGNNWHGVESVSPYPNEKLTRAFFDNNDYFGKITAGNGMTIPGQVTNKIGDSFPNDGIQLASMPHQRNWQVRVDNIPYDEYDLYVILGNANTTFNATPVGVRVGDDENAAWKYYVGNGSSTVATTDNASDTKWTARGFSDGGVLVEGRHYLKIHVSDATSHTLQIAPGAKNSSSLTLAAIQIVKAEAPATKPTLTIVAGQTVQKTAEELCAYSSITDNGTLIITANGVSTPIPGISGNGKVVKEGPARVEPSSLANTIGVTVNSGAIVFPLNYTGSVTVNKGGAYEFAGDDSSSGMSPTLTLNGGTLRNVGGSTGSTKVQFEKITLTSDSFVDAPVNFYSIASGYNQFDYNLNGHNLTKIGAGEYVLRTPRFVGGGSLEVVEGYLKLYDPKLDAKNHLKAYVSKDQKLLFGSANSKGGADFKGIFDLENYGTVERASHDASVVCRNLKNAGTLVNAFTVTGLYEQEGSPVYTGMLTVAPTTGFRFPAESSSLTITCGTLSLKSGMSAESGNRAEVFVGENAFVADLTYNTSAKTVSYVKVRENGEIYWKGTTPDTDTDWSVSRDFYATSEKSSEELTKMYAGDTVVFDTDWIVYLSHAIVDPIKVKVCAEVSLTIGHEGTNTEAVNIPNGSTIDIGEGGYVGFAWWNNENTTTIPMGDVQINGGTFGVSSSNRGKTLKMGHVTGSSVLEVAVGDSVTVKSIATPPRAKSGKILVTTDNADGTTTYTAVEPIAKIGDQIYASLSSAVSVANANAVDADHKIAISLSNDCSENVNLGKFVTLDPNGHNYTGTLMGSGTYIVAISGSTIPTAKSWMTANTWTGTVWLKGDGTSDNIKDLAINNFASENSKLAFTGCKSYFASGIYGGGTINAKEVWLIDEGDKKALTITNGANAYGFLIKKLMGDGTLNTSGSSAGDGGICVQDASEFEGNIVASTRGAVKLGVNSAASGTTKTIEVHGTANLAGGKSWTAGSSITIKSTGTIKGSGTLAGATTFEDGASIDLSKGVLSVASNKAVMFAGGVKLITANQSAIEDGTAILTGVSSEPEALNLIELTVNGETDTAGRLYYDNGAIKYTVAAAETWTPNTDVLAANKILDWTADDAWLKANGDVATWNFSESSMKPNVQIDATMVKGVKIAGQVYVGTVVVSGTLDEGKSFQFHSSLYSPSSEVTVDGTHEVNASIDCLHTEGVNLASLNGELGMKVPITGPIAFGSNTRLVFATGSKGGDASKAYGYTFVDRGGYITVRGAGKFIVPSSMYGIAFDIESTATAVYQESATITGAITGTGTVEFKNGVTKDLGSAVNNQTLHYVSSGTAANTLAWTGDGSTSFTSTDSKTKPVVKVESDATLKLNAHDCSGWNGGLTEHGWFVNNGTLVFSKPTNTRFWRDHIVFGPESTMKIDTGDHHIYMYGGVGTADNCQLTLASGEATIEKGAVNSGKSNHALYIGFTGDGYASKDSKNKGVGINVGTDATLTVSVPLMGGDPMAKYGAGALVLENNSAYTGSIALYGGSIKAASQIDLNRFTSKDPYRPAVSETQDGEMYVYALSYGKIKVDACGYMDVAEAMKHLTASSTIEIIDTTITKQSLESAYGITLTPGTGDTYTVSVADTPMEGADEHNLIFSEIMPKPSDKPSSITTEAGYDENGLESGWVELENTSTTKWVDLAKYKFLRVNRSKATSKGDYGAFPSVLIPPRAKFVFYTSERYSNSADMTVSAWVTPHPSCVDAKGKAAPKPILYGAELHNMLVWPDKVNPKKFAFVRLLKGSTIIDTVVIPSDIPEGHSIIIKPIADGEATVRYMTNKPTKGEANTSLEDESIVKLGPNVGPLYEIAGGEKHTSASEFGEVAMAKADQDYTIKFALNPTMSPTEAAAFREADGIKSIKLVYRTWNEGTPSAETEVEVNLDTKTTDAKDQGDQYTTAIPSSALPNAGELIQWKFKVVDNANNEWTTPSFHNKDDGYEWYGTIVEPNADQMSATLPTWHMFVDSASKAEMDKDAPNQELANNARVAIYDSSTSTYYDYVRIDLRGNTSARFNKKSHGLRFSKVNPMKMKDVVTGETHEGIRKTSLIAEPADPSRMRQMMAFWLWNKMGNKVPFDFPVRCNLNGEFYQLAFNSERFTDELIEDVYGLDKFGYGYKNVGTLKSNSSTTAGSIEKKTPDDGNESDVSVLQNELRAMITAAGNVTNDKTGASTVGLNNSELTKFVVQKFDLPAWLNYLASARITQETDDVWANISIYYDNAEMKEADAYRGTGTWMPLGYDFNLTFGQYYDNGTPGMRANTDWFKSHPFYGGNRVRCYQGTAMNATDNEGNNGIEAVWQNEKFRRLYLRRLRTLMDQELKAPGTAEKDVPVMAKMREMYTLMSADAKLDLEKYSDNGRTDGWSSTFRANDVWGSENWPIKGHEADGIKAGIDDIWTNYIQPRQTHLFETHSVRDPESKGIGYGTALCAGIPNKQSDIATLKDNITIANLTELSSEQATELAIPAWFTNKKVLVIQNANNEAVDMSGWKLSYSVEFTLPAGTVVDANDDLYVVADRRAYIEELADSITDQVIVGNATFSGAGPIMLQDGNGVEVIKIVPMTDARRYLRLAAFYGNTTEGDGQVGEWFELKNIATDGTELNFKDDPITVCFLKDDKAVTEETDAGKHCHVTINSGKLAAGKTVRFVQADYSDKGWSKIQNNKQIINIYDMYGVSGQTLKVTQKDYPFAYGHGAFLETTSTGTTVKNSDWIQVWTEGDLTIGNFTADGIDGMAKDLTVRASAPMTIDFANPTFGDKASLKIEGATSVVTIKGTATKTVAGPTVIKSKGSLVFEEGVYDLISTDDCIQADGDITINGGTFICHSTGNDGIDANGDIVINGGTIYAFTAATEEDGNKSTGLDVNSGYSITINGGTVIATSVEATALSAMTIAGTQKHQIVEVSEVSSQTKAIGDVIVTFPEMETSPAAVLVSTPNLTEEEITSAAPDTVEIVAEDAEAGTDAVQATVPASWVADKEGDAKVAAAEAFVLGLAEPTEKPMVSSEPTTETDSIRIVDNVAPRYGTGVTVKRTLFVGTTPGEEAADTSIEETNGGFTVPLPTGDNKVKYIKIKYSFK